MTTSTMPYGDVSYADPGYQADKKKRYPLDSEAHCRAAWSYINQADNAAKYTAEQVSAIKGRIKAAGKKYGITFADNTNSLPVWFTQPRSFIPSEHPRVPSGAGGGEFTGGGGGGKAPAKPVGKATAHRPAAHGHAAHKGSPAHQPGHDTLSYDPGANTGTGYGSKNGDPRVHKLQEALNRLGLTDMHDKKLKDDGKLGPRTTSAVKRAQQRLGLKPDGKVTPALLAKLAATKSLPHPTKRSAMLDVCVRSFDFEFETRAAGGDGRTLEGYAAVFNTPTRIRDVQGDFEETILPGAFKRSIEARMPVLQYDHGKDPRIGGVPIGSIDALAEDTRGLHVRAQLYDHPDVERIRQAIAGRSIKGMSFRFGVPDKGDTWTRRTGNMDLREIRDADVHELGPVVFPAYDTTTVTVRSLLAQLDPAEHRSLIRELAAELRLAVDLDDFTGRSAQGADGGEPDTEPDGDVSPLSNRQRLDDGALRLRGILT